MLKNDEDLKDLLPVILRFPLFFVIYFLILTIAGMNVSSEQARGVRCAILPGLSRHAGTAGSSFGSLTPQGHVYPARTVCGTNFRPGKFMSYRT